MEKFKNTVIFILFAIVAILLTLRGCENSKSKPTTTLVDTSYIHTTDTVYAKQDTIKLKIFVKSPTSTFKDTSDKSVCNIVNIYKDSISDSNLVIYYIDTVKGKMINKDMSYKLKVPLIINNTTTVTIRRDSIIDRTKKLDIYAGLSLGVVNKNQIANFGPFVNVRVKNNLYGYKYGLLDKSHNVSVGIRLHKK